MATDTPTTTPMQVSAPYTQSLWTGKRFIIAAFLFFNMFINYMDRINLSVAAPIIARQYKWDPALMGWIFSGFLWTYMVCLIPWGRATDKYGSRNVGAISMTLWSLGGMATGAIVGFGSMMASRLALGVGEAASFPISGKVVRQWFPAGERGLATAIFNAGTFAGPAISAPVVAWLVLQTGWRWSFVITGAIGIIWAILWFTLFRSPAECSWLPEDERNYLLSQTGAPPDPHQGRARPSAQPQNHVGAVHHSGLLCLHHVPVSSLAALLSGKRAPHGPDEGKLVHRLALPHFGGAGHPDRQAE
jgi:ACS family glucarate transporter-like MFS transporter